MAGGVFPGYAFSPNIKCIVFTVGISGLYWFAPPKNIFVLIFLLWFPYVLLAWYDYAYQCRDKMKPTLIPFGRALFLPFKPPEYQREFETMPPEAHRAMDTTDHIAAYSSLLSLVVSGLFVLVKK
jgi:hypothetical protein